MESERRKQHKKKAMDMLHGSIADKLFFFALPIGFMGIFEQLFNSADIFVLGRFVGKDAMAAVGNNMPVISLLVMLLLGVSLGANVTIAQYLGGRHYDKVEKTVQTAILLSAGLGILLTAIGELIATPALAFLGTPSEVYDSAATYLRIYLLVLPFLSLYNFEAAIFRSCGDGRTPLYSLIAANALNITLDFASVLVFDWGLAGVVWATVVSYALNAALLLVLLCRTTDQIRLEWQHLRFAKEELIRIVKIGLPAGMQGMVFALSNILIQSSINSLGPEAMAASAAGVVVEANIYCFVNGFTQATTTFVGQNYGAKNLRRCFRITKVAFAVEAAFLLVITALVLIFSRQVIGWFSSDPEVISLGSARLFIVGSTLYINGVIDIISGSLRGYSYSLPPAIVVLVGICSVRITWIYTVFAAHHDFLTLLVAYPASWIVTLLVLAVVYKSCRKRIIMGLRKPV